VGSSLLDSSGCGWGAIGSLSEDLAICSFSEGRLSPSNLCMLGCPTPRYGLLVAASCSSLHQVPLYRVTALVFFPVLTGGQNRRTLYPLLFLLSNTDMNVMCLLFACAELVLLRAMCMSSSQICVLLVSLELAMVEQSRV
jgi:hypothetical protein